MIILTHIINLLKDHKDFFQNLKNRIFVQIKENIFKQINKALDDNDIMVILFEYFLNKPATIKIHLIFFFICFTLTISNQIHLRNL